MVSNDSILCTEEVSVSSQHPSKLSFERNWQPRQARSPAVEQHGNKCLHAKENVNLARRCEIRIGEWNIRQMIPVGVEWYRLQRQLTRNFGNNNSGEIDRFSWGVTGTDAETGDRLKGRGFCDARNTRNVSILP